MNERRQDFELLQRFTRQGEQSAFADVVRRHLGLVFGTALRKVEDPGGAQEVAQNVFTALARKTWRFAPDDSLPAWLHKAALLESKSWLRGELGRRRREEAAAELGTTMKTPEDQPAFHALVPMLDEALLSLREKDRTALLLRFYESHSLRDVGAAFGVSEDTARKRVQSALEKLSEFFKRRGFKTATVAATAAALQHAAVSTSTAMVSTVVGAALQGAPPAVVGLGAWLARLASLSRVQTAAVCVALAAAPVGWQLNKRHAAGEEVKQIQAQLLAAQNEHATVQTEIERLRAISGRLEQSVAQTNEAAVRAAASAQAFAAWKKKIRGLLTAADYHWSDDSPFVRIPKSVLLELSKKTSRAEPFGKPGVVEPYARELMGLTPSERQSVEAALHRHFAEVDERLAAGIYETNTTRPGRIPDAAVAATVFVFPELGDEAKQPADQRLPEVRRILGEERWPLVQVRLEDGPGHSFAGADLVSILNQSGQDLAVWVATDDKGTPTMGYSLSGPIVGGGNEALSMFLPEGDPNRTDGVQNTIFGGDYLSKPLRQRALAWLQEQARARLGEGARR
jgi:RNA polymerase sigma factor (sigma-70 family)